MIHEIAFRLRVVFGPLGEASLRESLSVAALGSRKISLRHVGA